MDPKVGFGQTGDIDAALRGNPGLCGALDDGVLRTCQRAALAHRLFRVRMLPKLQVCVWTRVRRCC